MYKIGVIGDYDSICGFAALGLDIYSVTDEHTASETLKKLAGGGYGIIYITENYFLTLTEQIAKFHEQVTPAIIPIPGVSGAKDVGKMNMKGYVEQAVGSDIIYNND